MNEWIKAETCWPEASTSVLVLYRSICNACSRFHPSLKIGIGKWHQSTDYYKWTLEDCTKIDVEAWMPLPQILE